MNKIVAAGVLLSLCYMLIGSESKLFDCKRMNETCRGVPKCCGENTVCLWEGKWNPVKGGRCSTCGTFDKRCVRDDQCCAGLQCDKDSRFYLNGFCRPPRPAGAKCHTDSMCRVDCRKKWYEIYGVCQG